MGLFSSSKKTAVGTAVLRVIDDENMPDNLKQGLLQAVFLDQDIAGTFLETILNGGNGKIESMYRYAEEDYHYGLPKGTVVSRNAGFSIAKGIIEDEIDSPITVRYLEFLPLSNTHIGWQVLTDTYGYDHETNEITTLSASTGFPVYLDNLISIRTQAMVDEAEHGALQDLGPVGRHGYTPERPTNDDPAIQALAMPTVYEIGAEEGVEIHTIHEDDSGDWVRDVIFVSLSGYDLEPEYYQCGYIYQDGSGDTAYGYWTYAFNAGTHPELDEAFDADDDIIGTYFPFVFFRNRKNNLTHDSRKDTEAYKSSTRLLSFLGMNYAAVGEEIHQNPDISDVEQAYMMMGISTNSTNQTDLHYLYEYFSRLETQTLIRDPDAVGFDYARYFNNGVSNSNALLISDTHSAMRLSYYSIEKRLVAGKIGEPGEYGSKSGSIMMSRTVRRQHPKDGSHEWYVTYEYDIPQRIYRKQITTSLFEEITVTNPKMAYDIYKGYSHTASDDEEELLIPLDKTITDTFTFKEKEEIYSRSLHFVFNSRVTEKVKWYESMLFKFVLLVVAVVLTVMTLGSAWSSLAAAAGIGIGALAMTLVTMIVEAALYSYAFELVVRELGLENSFVIAILATVAAFYLGYRHKGIDNAPWASELLTASNGLMSGMDAEGARLMEEYNSKTEAFNLMAEEAYAELEEAQALLNVDTLLDPLVFVGLQPQTVLGEEPEDYYHRTIHQGNLGTLGYDAVASYVDYSLRLPELNTTIGDVIHE